AERTNQQIPDFEYDDYGNLVLNRDKEIQEIRYNHLNLPTKISFTNNREISYFYDASGVKIKKEVNDGTQINTTAYQDGFQYSNNLLEFFPTAEGYVKTTRQSSGYDFNYVFNHTDHLGNIRLRYTQHPETGATEILQEDHYYPFGLKHKGYNNEHFVFSLESNDGITLVPATLTAGDGYKYKYQGQEHQDEFGLNWDSFKWRNYSPDLGRFWVIDPLAEKYAYQSVYQFASNQPIHANEIEGLENRFDLNMRSYTAEKLSNRGHGNVKENYRAIQQAEASAISKPIKAGASLLNSLIVGGFNFVTGRGTMPGSEKMLTMKPKP